MYPWEKLKPLEDPHAEKLPAPYDGELYLIGTSERIFSGRWVRTKSRGHWDFQKTAAHLPREGLLFYAPCPSISLKELTPKVMTPGLLNKSEILDFGLKKFSIPSDKRVLIRIGESRPKWLEATFAVADSTWNWIGEHKKQSKVPQKVVSCGFLIDSPPTFCISAEIKSIPEPLWA